MATLAPCLHRDGVSTTWQRHPLLPLVVAWSVQQSLLLSVGRRAALHTLRRKRGEAVGREHTQTAVRLTLPLGQFFFRSESQQRTALSGCSGGSWIGVKIAFGILFVIILRYKYIAHFRYLAPLRYDSGKTRISKKSVLTDMKARGFRNLFSPSTKTGTRGLNGVKILRLRPFAWLVAVYLGG